MQTQECSGSGETQFRTLWPKLLPVFCGTCFVSRNGTELFSRKYFWWKGVWQISGFICSFADSPWSSYMRPHANFGFLSKLFSWVYQPTEKPICISLSNGCSKQRCPRVMMITWRHCDGPIVPLKFHRKCLAILMLFQKSQSIQSSSWQCFWGNLLQEAAAWVWAT